MCTLPTHDPQQPNPGIFTRRDEVRHYLRRCQTRNMPPQTFRGTFQIEAAECCLVSEDGQSYHVVGCEHEPLGLVRYLRQAMPALGETGNGGYKLVTGFVLIETVPIDDTPNRRFLLIDWPLAKSAIEKLEERFGRPLRDPSRMTPARGSASAAAPA